MTLPPGGREWVEGGGLPADDDSAAAADALTCIRSGVYTPAPHAAAEIDDLMVKNLIETLAEVALNVASRMRTA